MKLNHSELRKFAEKINQEIFLGILDLDALVIRTKRTEKQNARAWYYHDDNIGFDVIVLIEAEHTSIEQAYASIAHELIHYWQDSIAELNKLAHNNQTFRYWKYRICKLYGIQFTKYFQEN